MRFNWIVNDQVTIPVSANAWRPPDYITSPTLKISNQSKKASTATTSENKLSPEERQPMSPATQRPVEEHTERKSPGRWRKRAFDKTLPFPPTHITVNRYRLRYLLRPRAIAIFAATTVAFSILVGLTILFSEKLDEVASKVDKVAEERNIVHQLSHVAPPLSQNHVARSRRKLLTVNTDASPNAVQIQLPHNTIVKPFSTLYTSAKAIHRILRVLSAGQFFTVTAAVLQNVPHQIYPSLVRPNHPVAGENSKSNLQPLQDEVLRMYRELIFKQFQTPLQIPQNTQKHPCKPPSPSSSTPCQHDVRDAGGASSPLSFVQEVTSKRHRGLAPPQQLSSVLHSHALAVIGSVSPSERSVLANQSSNQVHTAESVGRAFGGSEFSAPIVQVSVKNSRENRGQNTLLAVKKSPEVPGKAFPVDKIKVRGRETQSSQTLNVNIIPNESLVSAEKIEVWKLPGEKSLCRLFNIGYLPDGTLVLPKWMKKHTEFIFTRCGIKQAFFAFNLVKGTKLPEIDKEVLRAKGISKFTVNASSFGQDLFGTSTPRNHMPHFVSDIFFHLVACEALLGTGKKLLSSSALVPPGSLGEEIMSIPTFPDLKPALFLQDETWNRPSTDWVPRLAQFFRHPKIGFTFLRTNRGSMEKDGLGGGGPVVTIFRSVVTSNLKSHEPYGLFGANLTNIVFEANGITRKPAWMTSDMQERPCRVSVTVLTRQGPRALLRLRELRDRVELLGKLVGIRVDIKIVDFGGITFDEQVKVMQETNVLIATHGAGNANFIFMRPSAAVIEVFPFAYKAGPFDRFAEIFGLEYKAVMSSPQTDVFKECMNRHETNQGIKRLVFSWWDKAVAEEKVQPWVHRLELEKEFGEPGKSEGMTTRGCVRLQELEFNIDAVSRMVVDQGKGQCALSSQRERRHSLQSSAVFVGTSL